MEWECDRCQESLEEDALNIMGTWLICDDCYEDL